MAKDVANGIDVWTKRVRARIVEKWYRGEEAVWFRKTLLSRRSGEGADFFSGGRTLGAGGSGLWHQGSSISRASSQRYRIVANGPIRVIFELSYDTLRVGPTSARETRRNHALTPAGISTAWMSSTKPAPGGRSFVRRGAGKTEERTPAQRRAGGMDQPLGAPGEDSANGSLGTGIIVPSASYAGSAQDSANHLILGKARSGQWCTYYAGAGWTGNGDFPAARLGRRRSRKRDAPASSGYRHTHSSTVGGIHGSPILT